LSNTRAVTKAYLNGWFIAVMGQAIRSDRKLPHWFDVDRWIRLTRGTVYGPLRTVPWADGAPAPLTRSDGLIRRGGAAILQRDQ
jgi:hypothetical protein